MRASRASHPGFTFVRALALLAGVWLVSLSPVLIRGENTGTAAPNRAALTNAPHTASPLPSPVVQGINAQMPVLFSANEGQAPAGALYAVRAKNLEVLLRRDGITLLRMIPNSDTSREAGGPPSTALGGLNVIRESIEFTGSNPNVSIEPLERQTVKVNYLLGPDPKRWVTSIPSYARVRYHNLYPGIDLVFYGTPEHTLEYDLVVAAGADPARIRLRISGDGRPRIDESGNLLLDGAADDISLDRPTLYQNIANGKRVLGGSFVQIAERDFAFKVVDYDRSRPLIIDPTLVYSTLLGGVHDDEATNIVLDSSNNSYIVGFSASADFPVSASAYQPDRKAPGTYIYNTVVLKFDPSGNLLYSTFLGGTGQGVNYYGGDFATGVAVDAAGNAYICGSTDSVDFPVTSNAYSSTPAGGFVSEISPDGSTLEYSSYFPASVNSIALNPQGQLVLAGTTGPGLPTTSTAYMSSLSSGNAAFASILDLTQSGNAQLTASSYYGTNSPMTNSVATGNSQIAFAVDASGNVWLGGKAFTPNLPTTANAYQTSLSSLAPSCGTAQPTTLNAAAYFAELSPDLSQLKYATYFSGQTSNSTYNSSCQEWVEDMAFDATGNLYLAGTTSSPNFPTTPGAYMTSGNNTYAVWAAEFPPAQFTASSSAPVWSTLLSTGISLGGSAGYQTTTDASPYQERNSDGQSMAVDGAGNVWLAGHVIQGLGPGFITSNAFESGDNYAGGGGFVAELGAGGTQALYGSFLVGYFSNDVVTALAVDRFDNVYTVGVTQGEQQSEFDAYQVPGYAYFPYEFPITGNAFQTQFANGDSSPDGNDIFFSILGSGNAGAVGPTSGGNTGDVTLTITGSGFQSGATCELVLGGTTITSTSAIVSSGGASITCTFALNGAAVGSYNVEVANPDGGGTFTSNNAFTVNSNGQPNVWVNIVGRDVIRTGSPSQVTISYGNSGEVDAYFTQLDVQFSPNLNATYNVGVSPGVALTAPAITSGSNTSGSYLSLMIPRMPAGSSGSFVVTITDSTNNDNYAITASLGHPWYTTAEQAGAELTAQSQSFSSASSCEAPTAALPSVSSCLADYLTDLQAADSLNSAQVENVASNMLLMLQQSQSGPPPIVGGTTVPSSSLQLETGTLVVSGIPSIDNEILFHVTGTSQQYVVPLNSSNCVSTSDNLNGAIGESLLTCTLTGVTAPVMNGVILAGETVTAGLGPTIIPNPDACFTTTQNVAPTTFTASAKAGQCIISNLDPPENPTDNDVPPPPPPIPPQITKTQPGKSGAAIDPNGKSGTTGDMSASQYVNGTSPLPYEVFFENEATAALPAARVVVSDQLNPALLNLNAVSLGPISWGGTNIITPPSGVTSYTTIYTPPGVTTYVVNVQGSLNTENGLLTWTFQTIDPSTHLPPTDPTVGFLPPDADGVEGQGSVDFTVMPAAGLTTGTVISNTASVVFDANAAISTHTWTNTVDITPPTSSVTALPATTPQTSFTVSWSGTTVASAIAYYNIYVSTNGGAFTLWQSAVTTTSANFTGAGGDTYGFFSQAVDKVGNVEALKTQADTTTQIVTAGSIVTTWPTASAITYGQTLSSSTLSGGLASVPGAFAFTTPGSTPLAGTQSESVTFTPQDTSEYSPVPSTVSVLVNKAPTSISLEPTPSNLTYGQSLVSSTLTGGAAVSTITNASVPGAFAFTTPTTVPPSGSSSQGVTFTPSDTSDYLSTTGSVTVQANPASLTITWPTASAIAYGQTLSASTLSGGSAVSGNTTVNGTFAFANPTTAPTAGTQSESVTFTPANTSQYLPMSSTVSVLVQKAPTVVTVPPTASAINSGQTLGSSTLSGGTAISTVTNATVPGVFAFTSPTTTPTATGPQSVSFTAADANDYLGTTASVNVTVNVSSAPVAQISPTSINFGSLYLGSIVTKTVTITNTSNATMTINDPRIAIVQGGDSDEFITLNFCPRSLAAGRGCTMTVTFVAGPFYNPQTATLIINDNAAGNPQTVPLTATVIDPVAQFNLNSLNFGIVKTKTGSATKSVTLTSIGGTPLSISTVTLSGADPGDFAQTSTCSSTTLNPKKTCAITLTFKPTAKGLRSASLRVTDNARNSPQSIPLSGSGD